MFVTATGQVLPCCMTQYYDSPFSNDPLFNVNNASFGDIITSDRWHEMLASIPDVNDPVCTKFCSSEGSRVPFDPDETPYNGGAGHRMDIIQVELTNTCTLKCQYCRRQTHPHRLNRDHLPLDVAWDVISHKHWFKLIDCAIYGDPIWYQHNYELLDRMIDKPTMDHYAISLAATGRGMDYWKCMIDRWDKLNQRGVDMYIVFGIDGGPDTSKIHRVNQDWDEITQALQLVAQTDITPVLQFIPFNHNEHDLDYMMLLAEKWGAEFLLRRSHRFVGDDPNKPSEELFDDYEKRSGPAV
jgi:MoaA/NifB/PqqE/SkfB family radical SAM enzyme